MILCTISVCLEKFVCEKKRQLGSKDSRLRYVLVPIFQGNAFDYKKKYSLHKWMHIYRCVLLVHGWNIKPIFGHVKSLL